MAVLQCFCHATNSRGGGISENDASNSVNDASVGQEKEESKEASERITSFLLPLLSHSKLPPCMF